jgi:hypothetical protein
MGWRMVLRQHAEFLGLRRKFNRGGETPFTIMGLDRSAAPA